MVALTETQRPDFADPLLEGYQHFSVPSPLNGRRGYGLSIYVREGWASGISIWKIDPELSVMWLKFPGSIFCLDAPVFFGVVYIPPQGSHRLQQFSCEERFAELASHVGQAQALGHVLMCGDFNACVSEAGSSRVTAAGSALLDLCQACDLTLLTGRLPGDQPAVPSFAQRIHTGASRPDHIVASSILIGHMRSLHVDTGRGDSDHYPLQLFWDGHDVMEARVECRSQGSFARLRWDRRCLPDYQRLLLGATSLARLELAMNTLGHGDTEMAAKCVRETLMATAQSAGMRLRTVPHSGVVGSRSACVQAPWFDSECRQLKQAVHAARAVNSGVANLELREARKAFNIGSECVSADNTARSA